MELFSNAIRDHIKELMQQQNLSISELARRSGLTQSTVDSVLHIRDKNPRIDTIHKLIKALNLSVPEFFNHARFKDLE
ncbi:helix-turn-helix domain-containing protein (plasmid) [Lysinibacillus capsici]|uniref:helix-turn-helix domain-containing protein n=1 Tax=Lysinibacillus capsici TaxID=2115968 RepID=UPI0021D8BCC6|nr:helix-turn-helix transcriptional regulator [Lysinibacillus capsici]UYB50059.1 helix-turn-helix domain-containing protein [Lysinibacillus capsici]